MKILYIAPGDSIHTYRWLKYFSSENETYLISTAVSGFNFNFTNFFFLDSSSIKDFKTYLYKARDFIEKKIIAIKPDIVHVHFLAGAGWVPGLIRFHPLVITLWGSDILSVDFTSSESYKALSGLCLSRSDLVTADSYLLLSRAKDFGAVNTELIAFGPEKYFKKLPDKSALREKYGIPHNKFVLLSIRALKPLYRITEIIKAISYLDDSFFLIITDYNSLPAYSELLHKLINELNLTSRIKFISPANHEEVNELYNTADLAVSLPETDGTPASFFEAMAAGLPVLCNSLPGYGQIFQDEENIFMTGNIVPKALAVKVKLLRHSDRGKVTESGFKTAETFSFSGQMAKMDTHYKNIYNKFRLAF